MLLCRYSCDVEAFLFSRLATLAMILLLALSISPLSISLRYICVVFSDP